MIPQIIIPFGNPSLSNQINVHKSLLKIGPRDKKSYLLFCAPIFPEPNNTLLIDRMIFNCDILYVHGRNHPTSHSKKKTHQSDDIVSALK